MASAGPATIVVVEGDPAARELIDQALRGCGRCVLVTRDPLEALKLGERVRIDVLVDSLQLCRERPALVERLRSIQPELRLVRVLDPDEPSSDGLTLRRPFSLEDLESAIAQALTRERLIG